MNNRVVRIFGLALVLVALLPGCTFYSWTGGVRPRTGSELSEINPAIYILLAVFVIVAVVGFFMAASIGDERNYGSNQIFSHESRRQYAMNAAVIATIIILLLVG